MDMTPQNKHLFTDICQIIETAKGRVALTANAELTLMYWHIGIRINIDILRNQRAEYGKQIVSTLANQLHFAFQIVAKKQVVFNVFKDADKEIYQNLISSAP